MRKLRAVVLIWMVTGTLYACGSSDRSRKARPGGDAGLDGGDAALAAGGRGTSGAPGNGGSAGAGGRPNSGGGGASTGGAPAAGGSIAAGGSGGGAGGAGAVEAGPPEAGTPEAGVPDAAPSPDASVDASPGVPDASATDASVGSDATPALDGSGPPAEAAAPCEAGTSATCTRPALLLTAITGGVMPDAVAGTYFGGSWSTRLIGSDVYGVVGGGIAPLPGGRALAVMRAGSSGQAKSAIWDGAWGDLSNFGTANTNVESVPVTTATGAVMADGKGVGVNFDLWSFDDATSTWSATAGPALGTNNVAPGVAITAGGDELVVYTDGSYGAYHWATHGTLGWSTPGDVPGFTPASLNNYPLIRLVRRAGMDELLLVATIEADPPVLQSAVFTGGAWSSPVTVATDLESYAYAFSLSALPDGRAVVAYHDDLGALHIALYSGSWTTPRAVPGMTAAYGYAPESVAPGLGSNVLELAFVATDVSVQHASLTDEANWTWSNPTTVVPPGNYNFVSLATLGP